MVASRVRDQLSNLLANPGYARSFAKAFTPLARRDQVYREIFPTTRDEVVARDG
jgi:hypothetical protein